MTGTKTHIILETSSLDEVSSEGPSQYLDGKQYMEPFTIESCLPGNNYSQILHDLLSFESHIERKFLTANAVYKYTCGNSNCNFACGVPHLMLIIRVRGLADDQIGIVLQSARKTIENILPQVPKGRYSYRTWRNSRWKVIGRMLQCLYVYYGYGDMQRICRLVSRPLYVSVLGGVMGKVMDLSKRFLLASPGQPEEDDEPEMLLMKEEFM